MDTRRNRKGKFGAPAGFALVATFMLLILLATLSVGLISLSSIVLREKSRNEPMEDARANARLALTLAIGQLQVNMGPDTRVSASSGLLATEGQRNWTGVWDTLAPDGKPWIRRDPETYGLEDLRSRNGYRREDEVVAWLVSGLGDPAGEQAGWIPLVDHSGERVSVPAIRIGGAGGARIAWWTGDLGTRANLATDVSAVMMGLAGELPEEAKARVASGKSLEIAGADAAWTKERFHDFTVLSEGLDSNARDGGDKVDLAGFLSGERTEELPREGDALVGPANRGEAEAAGLDWDANPFRETAPVFGRLADWVRIGTEGEPGFLAMSPPEESGQPGAIASNLAPAKAGGAVGHSFAPVIVEASEAHSFSWNGDGESGYHLRKHLYPRVLLWNPYSVAMDCPEMMLLLQTNGRKSFWIEGNFPVPDGSKGFAARGPWVAFDGGRSRDFQPAGISPFSSPAFNDPYMGSHYYRIAAATFGPGECLVFSPKVAADYQNGIPEDGGAYDLAANVLSATQAPGSGRCLTIAAPSGDPALGFLPETISMESTAAFFAKFGVTELRNPGDDLRAILKTGLAGGAVDVAAFDGMSQVAFVSGSFQYGVGKEPPVEWSGSMKIPLEEVGASAPEPDERTREGLRLRWGSAVRTAAGIAIPANWNPRAAFFMRGACERFFPGEGVAGKAWGFGMYERLLPSTIATPPAAFIVAADGKCQADPLGVGAGGEARVMFFPPVAGALTSLGDLRHACLSELCWQPSSPLGNSLADPRIPLFRTVAAEGCFETPHIGLSPDLMRCPSTDSWAEEVRTLSGAPGEEPPIYDLSYEVNHTLWDRYRIRKRGEEKGRRGAFNVNSTSVDAWAAVLGGGRREIAGTGGTWIAGRMLADDEVHSLAAAMVLEVRERGPFLGLADFVNRRLMDDDSGRCGALENAIGRAGLNRRFVELFPINRGTGRAVYPQEIEAPLEMDMESLPASSAWGKPGFLTQADVLGHIGGRISARSDTFVIRAYGESGTYKACCEAVLQRESKGEVAAMGRAFRIVSFRWLTDSEI